MAKLNLSRIIKVAFPVRKYFREIHTKKQIVLHHTVSGKGIRGDVAHWIKSKFRLGTAIIIGRRGDINQLFSSKYWAYHLGVKSSVYKRMGVPYERRDMNSIGIELDSYGGLIWDTDKKCWNTVYGNKVSDSSVIHYPEGYRGYFAFERYTEAQIESVRQLLVFWGKRYNISLDYNEDMWDVSANALSGKSGVWSHTSYRFDKSDCHPQLELIEMLKSL